MGRCAAKSRNFAVWCALCTALAGLPPCPAIAQNPGVPVALELVLAVDTSASVDAKEFSLQMKGIAAAFRHGDVIAAISALRKSGGIAVSLVQWSEKVRIREVVRFAHVYDARTSKAFAFLVSVAPRASRSGFTAIGAGLHYSAELIDSNGFTGARRIIDLSGDGRANTTPNPQAVRNALVRRGFVINGLAILSDDDTLDQYYKARVAGGPGSFVERAVDYQAFAAAMVRKLLREITPPMAGRPVLLPVLAAAGRAGRRGR